MPSHLERPITVALSTPPAGAEATPTGLLMWTDGRASIATGRPFPPVTYQDVTYVVAQVNHSKPLPGPGLGAIVSRARRISDSIFAAAAANAVSSLVRVRQSGASLLPHIKDLHSVPVTVAVAGAAKADGLAGVKFSHIVQHGQDVLAWPGPAGGQLRTEHLPPRVRVFA
jgi:malate dehydrogenase (oxaloacetate-decarboxylating)